MTSQGQSSRKITIFWHKLLTDVLAFLFRFDNLGQRGWNHLIIRRWKHSQHFLHCLQISGSKTKPNDFQNGLTYFEELYQSRHKQQSNSISGWVIDNVSSDKTER